MSSTPSLTPETFALFNSVPDLYLILAPDLTILTASDAYLQAVHKKRDDIQGKYVFDVFSNNPELEETDAVDNSKASLEWTLQHKQPHHINLHRFDVTVWGDSDQFEERYWRIVNTPVLDDKNNVQYIIHKVSDCTDEVLSEKYTRNVTGQRDLLQAVLDQAPVAMCLFKGEDHIIAKANTEMCKIWDRTPEQVLGRPLLQALPEFREQRSAELLTEVAATGVPFIGREYAAQVRRDGKFETNYYNFVFQPLYDEQGDLIGVLEIAVELTGLVLARQKAEESERLLTVLKHDLERIVTDRTAELQQAKDKIEKERDRLHQLFMQAAAPICILAGSELVYELVNPAYQQLLPGRKLLGNSIVGEALSELANHPFAAKLKKAFLTGETSINKDELIPVASFEGGPIEDRYFNYTLQPRRNEKGEVDGIYVFAFEVTEQVTARIEAERIASRLQLITDSLPVLIGYLDSEEKYRFANKAYESWFNQDPTKLLGRPVRDVVGEKDYSGVKQYIDRALAGERLDFESKMPYREDFVKHIRTSYVPDVREGKVLGFYILVHDITEQVRTMEQLQAREREAQILADELILTNENLTKSNLAFQLLTQQQRQLVALVDNSSDFIGLATPEGKGVYINQAGLEMCGLEKEQIPELQITDFFADEHKDLLEDIVMPRLLEEGYWAGELNFKHFKTGEIIPVYYNCFSIKDPDTGEILGLATITIDITERKQQEEDLREITGELASANEDLSVANEQLMRTNIDLDNFIYAASHDLKAPISNIEGLMQILIDSLSDEVIAERGLEEVVHLIRNSIERFKRTIEHLTEVTKLQKENNQDAVIVNVSDVIAEVLLDLSPQVIASGANIEIDTNHCKGISFSEKNLRSIVYNLISNAIKYRSPERKPKVRITCQPSDGFVSLSVQDNGLGMNLTGTQKLFTMFGRLHDHVEGSGVGLYMVKKIVENAGGHIDVESTVGVGSTFTVHLKTDLVVVAV